MVRSFSYRWWKTVAFLAGYLALLGLLVLLPVSTSGQSVSTQIDYTVFSQYPDSILEAGYRPAHVPSGFLPELDAERPRIALALSGGGARGLAHIGVMQVLQRENIPIDIIAGTSMGAVVGALYTSGYTTNELERLTLAIDWGSLFSDAPSRRNLFLGQKETANRELLNLRLRNGRPYIPDALVTGERLFIELYRLMRNAPYAPLGGSFDKARTVFGAVATDLNSGNRIIFREGDIALALRGSMAVPVVFRALRMDGMLVVDGGAVENIPTRSARELGGEIVIAVDCATPTEPELDPDLPWEIANQVTTLMTAVNDSISRDAADVAIIPALQQYNNTDFQNVRDIIRAGRTAAEEMLPLIKDIVDLPPVAPRLMVDVKRVRLVTDASLKTPLDAGVYGFHRGRVSTHEINDGLTSLLRDLRAQGYGAASVRAELLSDNTLRVNVDLGVVRIIRIEGVPGRRLPMVLRDIRVKQGQPLRTEDAVKSLVQLHATGRYTTVYSTLRPHEKGGVVLTFILEESPLPRIGLGMGFDSDRRSRYLGEFAIGNPFPDLSEELVIRARYGERDRHYGLYTSADRISRSYIGWQGQIEYVEREQTIYDTKGDKLREANVWTTRAQAIALFNMRTWGRVSAGMKIENVADKLNVTSRERLYNGVLLRATLDTQDRRPFPNRGYLVDWGYESYIDPADETRNFNLFHFNLESVVQVQQRTVLRAGVVGGVAELSTPTTHRFAIGGLTNFPALPPYRFLAQQRIGGTFEARYDLISKVVADAYLLFRYDAMAFSDQKDWRPQRQDIIQSYALGFALDTILGPIEFWGAYSPASHTGPEETRVAVNFGYRF
ncbi:patatin-like phospholipase family protein [bacterium]|nr:patatin-like phospholipase family protein [bacterium]